MTRHAEALRRLRAADPAATVPADPREDLLRATLALPQDAPSSRPHAARTPRTGRALRLALIVASVLALVGGLGAALTVHGEHPLDLAAQAYAQTSSSDDAIVYSLVTSTSRTEPSTDAPHAAQDGQLEEWHRGKESHQIETLGGSMGAERIVSGGEMRMRLTNGAYRIIRAPDNEDSAHVIEDGELGFVATFRRAYENGQLTPGDDAEFNGRPAREYVADLERFMPDGRPLSAEEQRHQPPPSTVLTYFIDRQTGEPLGRTSVTTMSIHDGYVTVGPGEHTHTSTYVQTVRKLERLPVTPANLAKLHDFTFPRRRDGNGCLTGASRGRTDAPRADCGGRPHAVATDQELRAAGLR